MTPERPVAETPELMYVVGTAKQAEQLTRLATILLRHAENDTPELLAHDLVELVIRCLIAEANDLGDSYLHVERLHRMLSHLARERPST